MNNEQTNIGGRIIKLIIFFGIIGKLMWDDWHVHSTFRFETLKTALVIAVIVYLIITIYIAISKLFGNYLIGLIGLFGLIILGGSKEDQLIKSGYLTKDSSFYIFLVTGAIFVIYDLWKVSEGFRVGHRQTYVPSDYTYIPSQSKPDLLKQKIKENPQLFLDMSNELELVLNRKPTAEEVMKYIDSLKIEDHGLLETL